MTATTSQRFDAGRLFTTFATSKTAAEPFEDTLRHQDTTSPGTGARRIFGRCLDVALARGERATVGLVQWWRDGPDRRRTVRELRLMGRSRLADLGIEPEDVERVADAMLAARRDLAAPKGGRTRPRST